MITAVILRLRLLLIALAVGLAIVLIANFATDLILDQPVFSDGAVGSIDSADVAVMHLIDASLPMVALALIGLRSRALWITAILMTSMFWMYSIWQIWRDSLTGFAGGANIGLGIIMLASPFLVMLALVPAALIVRRWNDHLSVRK